MRTLILLLALFVNLQLHSQTQWVELITGVNVPLNSISSIKNVATWACGNNATVIKSTNSGIHGLMLIKIEYHQT